MSAVTAVLGGARRLPPPRRAALATAPRASSTSEPSPSDSDSRSSSPSCEWAPVAAVSAGTCAAAALDGGTERRAAAHRLIVGVVAQPLHVLPLPPLTVCHGCHWRSAAGLGC